MDQKVKNRRTYIIKLEGIFLSQYNYKDHSFTVPSENTTVNFNSIPHKFVSVDEWPNTTNLKCWNCDVNFNSVPKFIPINPEMIGVNEVYEVHGNFCSWNCAVEYAYLHFKSSINFAFIERSLYQIAEKFEGYKLYKLTPGPRKTLRKEYCGNSGLSVDEFKTRQKNHFNNYKVYAP